MEMVNKLIGSDPKKTRQITQNKFKTKKNKKKTEKG